MILERNVFQIKYGKIKDAIAIWKELIIIMQDMEDAQSIRMLSDITGPAYTLVLEFEMQDMLQIGLKTFQWANDEKLKGLYAKFVDICVKVLKEIYIK